MNTNTQLEFFSPLEGLTVKWHHFDWNEAASNADITNYCNVKRLDQGRDAKLSLRKMMLLQELANVLRHSHIFTQMMRSTLSNFIQNKSRIDRHIQYGYVDGIGWCHSSGDGKNIIQNSLIKLLRNLHRPNNARLSSGIMRNIIFHETFLFSAVRKMNDPVIKARANTIMEKIKKVVTLFCDKFRPLIFSVARKTPPYLPITKELINDLEVELVRAAYRFIPGHGQNENAKIGFPSFAESWIRSGIYSLVQSECKHNPKGKEPLADTDDSIDDAGSDSNIEGVQDDSFDLISKVEMFEQLHHTLKGILSGKELDILFRWYGLGGYEPSTHREISDIYDVSQARIQALCTRGLKKLKESDDIRGYRDAI